ncbi:MAG: hypothetical protein HQK72_09225 [Desulfamplus sp.]|nr:hypothetical protein [Desulfamplus sp.]
MKVTEPDVIKSGERDLIESIKDDLDWDTIKEIFIQRIKSASFDLNKDSSLSFDVNGGEIIVHKGEIAFRVDFELQTAMSIMFDRKGNYIPEPYNISPDKIDSTHAEDNKIDNHTKIKSYDPLLDDDELIIDDITSLEDEDILGDGDGDILDQLEDEKDAGELDPIADLNELNEPEEELDPIADLNQLSHSDDIEDILKESRDFWRTQDK